MNKAIFLLLSLLSIKIASGQSELPTFALFTNQDISVKECPFDKDADAIILLDEAVSSYDDSYSLITNRRVRIKILNQRGIDHGNISIPFYAKDGFEFIRNIEGVTFNPAEGNNLSYLTNTAIFTEKMNDRVSRVKFAMPNVKVGSIIEYKYESIMKHYGGLENWQFQSEIPTLKSCYLLQILPNTEFQYVVTKKPNYEITIKPKKESGQIYFEMNNIPGLRFEPYMDAPKDYLQRVEFQFSGYTNYYGSTKVNTTWKELAYTLATDEDLGTAVKKNLPVAPELKIAVDKETSIEKKVKLVFDFVQNNFTWNGHDTKYATENIKKVFEKKTGTSGELNLILLNLLNEFKIPAYPLEVAERSFGQVNVNYPLIDRFNKTVALVSVDSTDLILDVSEKYNEFGITPYAILNTYALLVDKKEGKLVEVGSQNKFYKTNVTINSTIDKQGRLTGNAVISAEQYAKQSLIQNIKEDQKKFIASKIEQVHDGLRVQNFKVDYPTESHDPVKLNIAFSSDLADNGGFLLLNYNLFTGLTKNPFTANERFTNINFGYPYNETIVENYELPLNAKADLPKSKTIYSADKTIGASRAITREGDRITVRLQFMQGNTLYSFNNYNELKEFYKEIVLLFNDPIVVKLDK